MKAAKAAAAATNPAAGIPPAKGAKPKKPPPPVLAPGESPEPASTITIEEVGPGVKQTQPPARFKSIKLAPKAVGLGWEHPPIAYTTNDLAVPGSLLHDWYHDNKRNKGHKDLCYYDQCGTERGCGKPERCMQYDDPAKVKRHPNMDDAEARAKSRQKWIDKCTAAASKGYVGYGT